jgi:hypothetical protein
VKAVHIDLEDIVEKVRKSLEHGADENGVCGGGHREGKETYIGENGVVPFILFAGVEGNALEKLRAARIGLSCTALRSDVNGERACEGETISRCEIILRSENERDLPSQRIFQTAGFALVGAGGAGRATKLVAAVSGEAEVEYQYTSRYITRGVNLPLLAPDAAPWRLPVEFGFAELDMSTVCSSRRDRYQ